MQLARIGICFLLMGATGALLAQSAAPSARARAILPFDSDWRFLKADTPGAEAPAFDDSQWRTVAVPHDWRIEGPFEQDAPPGGAGAFLPAGVGWYRKHFTLADYGSQARVFIEFDGVMANSDVWINGFHLGKRPYGYVTFRYELTGHVNTGSQPNVLAVRADDSAQPASRWYSGGGIYRHVRLIVMAPVHIAQWGVIVTTPSVTAGSATVSIQTNLVNQGSVAGPVTVRTTIIGPDGRPVQSAADATQTVAPGQPASVKQQVAIPNPQRWDIDSPNLYQAAVKVYSGSTLIDDDLVTFGIREFHFDAATGFWLNGKNFKIKGVCLHAEGGAVGAAVPLGTWEHRLAALKVVGVNAIRAAHNPPAPEFLDLCDRMGFLVMDEMFDCWTVAKNPYDYHLYFTQWSLIDTADTVQRDRNHPSIILYSAGNEIHDTPKADLAKGILKGLVDTFHQYDPTRPVTQALFRPNSSHDYTDGLADMLDVVGQNYREREILAAHQQEPARKIIGTENGHDRAAWLLLRDNAPYAGQFLWAGVDYLGESRKWPTVCDNAGLLDRTGAPKPLALQRESWWSDKPMVSIARRLSAEERTAIDPGYEPDSTETARRVQTTAADWTPAGPGGNQSVEVYSNCQQVELFLNGKSLGALALPPDASPRTWNVPFQPGTIKAVASNNGAVAATDELTTAGAPAKIALTPERQKIAATWDDVDYVTASVTDANGVEVPGANDLVTFSVSGPGQIAAVDNADDESHELFQTNARHAYHGQCIAIVRATGATGPITLTASAPGRAPASITIATQAP